MVGQKLPQVKEAMGQILSEINSEDFFTLILFSDFAQVNAQISYTATNKMFVFKLFSMKFSYDRSGQLTLLKKRRTAGTKPVAIGK